MSLRFLGKDSKPNESPTLYATDEASYIVQGWIVADPATLAITEVSDDETLVEVPARLMTHLANDGLDGGIANLIPPIVHVKDNGNYIIRGRRVTDPDILVQMDIPDHETCVEIAKADVVALLSGG